MFNLKKPTCRGIIRETAKNKDRGREQRGKFCIQW